MILDEAKLTIEIEQKDEFLHEYLVQRIENDGLSPSAYHHTS